MASPPSHASAPLPQELTGTARGLPNFSHLDQRFRLKMRGFIDVFMPPFYLALIQHFHMGALRQAGVFPVMFSLEFESGPHPMRFEYLDIPYRITLARHHEEGRPDRLLLDQVAELKGHEGSGQPGNLYEDAHVGPLRTFARARVVQALTRPLAPFGQRSVDRLEGDLSALAEVPWQGPFPSAGLLAQVPEGFARAAMRDAGAGWDILTGVWGISHTDPNQHVNVLNAIITAENLQAHTLYGAGLPVAGPNNEGHHIRVGKMVFAKPFFAGEAYQARAALHVKGKETVLLVTFHKTQNGGPALVFDDRPAIFIRYEGEMT